MLGTNPVMIPRNHLIEEAIQQASENESFESFHLLVDQLETPFSQEGKTDKLLKRPRPEEVVRQTFCGT